MSVEQNKVAVRRFIEALDTYDLGVLGEVCSPEVAQEYHVGGNVLVAISTAYRS